MRSENVRGRQRERDEAVVEETVRKRRQMRRGGGGVMRQLLCAIIMEVSVFPSVLHIHNYIKVTLRKGVHLKK